MQELNEISRMQSHFSPHFLLVFLICLVRALAILCKLELRYVHAKNGKQSNTFAYRTLILTQVEKPKATSCPTVDALESQQ